MLNVDKADPTYDEEGWFRLFERHLGETKATLWGRSWNVTDPVQREEAARWAARQVTAVLTATEDAP